MREKKSNNLQELGRMLFSENYRPELTEDDTSQGVLPIQNLEAHFSKKGRGGKVVTVIKGFEGNEYQLKDLAKTLKTKCAVGGSTKGNDIIIQGDCRDKIITTLQSLGHHVKRIGG